MRSVRPVGDFLEKACFIHLVEVCPRLLMVEVLLGNVMHIYIDIDIYYTICISCPRYTLYRGVTKGCCIRICW